jgi:hypothetical protein
MLNLVVRRETARLLKVKQSAGKTAEQVRTLKLDTADTFLRSYQALNY